MRIIERFRQIENDHYFYVPQSLHVTLTNVRHCAKPPSYTEEGAKIAAEVLHNVVRQHIVIQTKKGNTFHEH